MRSDEQRPWLVLGEVTGEECNADAPAQAPAQPGDDGTASARAVAIFKRLNNALVGSHRIQPKSI